MITKVIGRVTDTYWSVEENCHIDYESKKLIFDAKPEIKKDVVDFDSVVICEYDGNPVSLVGYNNDDYWASGIFIGGEFVTEQKREFHADIPEWREYVDVVVSNTDLFKEEVEKEYEQLIREYNAYVINGDEKLLAYCKLHGLVIEETDADELREFIPNQTKYNSDIVDAFWNSYGSASVVKNIDVSNSVNLASISTITSDNYTISC